MVIRSRLLPVSLLTIVAACAWGHRVEMQRSRRPSSSRRALRVRGDLPAGKMRVAMGSPGDLYRLSFSFCRDHYRVLDRFDAEDGGAGGEGADLLEIAGVPLDASAAPSAGEPNLMDLRLRPGVPLDLRLSVGRGEADLDLTALGVRRLILHAGGGPATVRFEAGNSRELEEMRIVGGEGPVHLQGLGWGRVVSLEFHGGAGGGTLDWSGPGPEEAAAFLDPGPGGLHLDFPRELGVALSLQGATPGKAVPGFQPRGTGWVSPNWGRAERRLTLVIDPGEGALEFAWKP